MDTLETKQDPHVVAIVCQDNEKNIHVTNVDVQFSEVKMLQGLMIAENIYFPFQFFQSIQVCDEKMYENLKERFNLS